MENARVNLRELADNLMDVFDFSIGIEGLEIPEKQFGEFIDYLEEAVSNVPIGKIITNGCFKQLIEELNVHLIFNAMNRLQIAIRSMDKDDMEYLQNENFEIEVEDDG